MSCGCSKNAESCGCGSKVMNWESYDRPVRKAEEPTVQEPDFMPNGDGRAIGQQNFAINLSPLHAEAVENEIGCDKCGRFGKLWSYANFDLDLCAICSKKEGFRAESRFDKLSNEIAEEYEEKCMSP